MNMILVKTKHSRDRYRLIDGSMGNYGNPANHVNHKYKVVEGIDRGHGYQGYMAVSYALTLSYIPQEAKDKIIAICKQEGLIYTH